MQTELVVGADAKMYLKDEVRNVLRLKDKEPGKVCAFGNLRTVVLYPIGLSVADVLESLDALRKEVEWLVKDEAKAQEQPTTEPTIDQ